MATVGFIGLGTMGAPMAGHLVRAGHQVVVWNRTPAKADPLVEAGATLGELANGFLNCSVVAICVNRSEDVAEVVRALRLSPCTVVVDHSTIEPEVARSLATELAEHGIVFLDCPITGGSMGAINGTLTVFCGGDRAAFEAVAPVLKAYGKRVEWVGPSGSGQLMKLANQIAVGGALIGLCESMAFAQQAGLEVDQAMSLIGSGAGGSWAFQNYGPKILAHDWSPGFSVKNQRKDFRYCLDAAREMNFDIPGTALVDALLARLEEAGRAEDATAALFEVYGAEDPT